MTSYGIDLIQRHQAITWTNDDWTLKVFCGIRLSSLPRNSHELFPQHVLGDYILKLLPHQWSELTKRRSILSHGKGKGVNFLTRLTYYSWRFKKNIKINCKRPIFLNIGKHLPKPPSQIMHLLTHFEHLLHTIKLGLYFLRPLADANFHAERRRCAAATSVFQRKLRRA